MKSYHITLALIIFGLIGCELEPNIASVVIEHRKIDGIIPMKVGYYWVYLTTSIDSAGVRDLGRLDTVSIVRDTLIGNELWFIFNDGSIHTNRDDGVWFLSRGQPRLEFPATLNDSSCTAPQPYPCEYYMKLVAVDQVAYVVGTFYRVNVYDWIFEPPLELGYKYFTVPHLGHVRMWTYLTTAFGYHFLGYTEELIYTNVD